mmetsp:Transcript_116603/g.362302  ORF Transcript_116603/g.362302 Transcript_116603/m.362302 type:complete len:115 (+) Transcript_116603:113-457(+)
MLGAGLTSPGGPKAAASAASTGTASRFGLWPPRGLRAMAQPGAGADAAAQQELLQALPLLQQLAGGASQQQAAAGALSGLGQLQLHGLGADLGLQEAQNLLSTLQAMEAQRLGS